MHKPKDIDLKVGLFVTLGVLLIMIAIVVLGSTEDLLSKKNHYRAYFSNVDGMIDGAKVVLGGVRVGTVENIDFDLERKLIRVDIGVQRKVGVLIRQDATVEIATQGVLGDKFISVTGGNLELPTLAGDSEIPIRIGKDLSQFLSKGDQLLVSLNSIAGSMDRMLKTFESNNRSERLFEGIASASKNLSSASEKLNRELEDLKLKSLSRSLTTILDKVNNGTGTLGALINDPSLYDDAKAFVGGANRNRIVRNLVRQTIRKSEEKDAEEGAPKK